jgi:hypothetical protein
VNSQEEKKRKEELRIQESGARVLNSVERIKNTVISSE